MGKRSAIKKLSNLSHSSEAKILATPKLLICRSEKISHQLFFYHPLSFSYAKVDKHQHPKKSPPWASLWGIKVMTRDACLHQHVKSFQSCSACSRVGRTPETGFYVLSRVCVAKTTGLPAASLICSRRARAGSMPRSPLNQCGELITRQGTVNWTFTCDELAKPVSLHASLQTTRFQWEGCLYDLKAWKH